MAKEAIEDLQRRRDLMAEIVELGKEMPDEDKMEALKAGVAVIKEIDALRARHPDDL
jgi:hypothetical protein